MTAALALAFTLWGAADSPVVAVDAPTAVLRGALALALVDDGAVVVPSGVEAGITLRVLVDGDGLQLATIGTSERAGTVAPGTPALVELEAVHRGLALVQATPPRAITPPAALFLDVDDRALAASGADARLAEVLAAALLDAGAPLADPQVAAERLCVVANASELVLSWGTTAARCDGRQMGVPRADLSPAAVIGDALRLRSAAAPPRPWRSTDAAVSAPAPATVDAPGLPATAPVVVDVPSAPALPPSSSDPLPSPVVSTAPSPSVVPPPARDAPPSPAAGGTVSATPAARDAVVRASSSAATAPSLDVRVGALGRLTAVDPVIDAELVWPLWSTYGVGPAAWLAASGALDPLPLAEVALAGGVGGVWRIADDIQVSATVVAGAFAHGWRFAEGDAGLAFDALAAAPLSVSWRPGPLGASLAVAPGVMTRARSHEIQGEVAWQRGAAFLGISAGLTWDIPAGREPMEKSNASPRGEGDG